MNGTKLSLRSRLVKTSKALLRILWMPVWLVLWLPMRFLKAVYDHFLSYMIGRIVRDKHRISSIKFIWYGDSVYLHPMIWGSLLLYALALTGWVSVGWLLLIWFGMLFVCYLTIMYNFDVVKTSVLAITVLALLGAAHFSTIEWAWNPLWAISQHVVGLHAAVTPGFFVAAAYLFGMLIACEVVWAWLFHRVEIDESYVYEYGFLQGSTREPIFARGLKRETKDLLEMLLLGAADIQHRTRKGFKRFKNVPFASLWLGTAIDALLDHNRRGRLAAKAAEDTTDEEVRVEDAFHDAMDDMDDGDDMDEDFDEDGAEE